MGHPPVDSQITFLYTRDLAQTTHFYENILGLQLKLDQGPCRIYQVAKDGYLGFCQRADATLPASDPPHVILTMVVPDVDEWHQSLQARGLQLQEPPTTNPSFKIYHFFLHDPNGYLLEIQQFQHPF